ncbi:MAG TPA: EAL domain-containing protein [Burkholderiaceae bacterium]|nr:EAL domain-containing protein [Burkholderiaceae bacterium]
MSSVETLPSAERRESGTLGSAIARRQFAGLAAVALLPIATLALVGPETWHPAWAPYAVSAALAAVGALALSVHLARRIVEPLGALIAATNRVARRDFAARVRAAPGDELGDLAMRFNEMAGRLGLRFATLEALAQIDEIILNKLDVEAVARIALTCVRQIAGADFTLLGLYEAGNGDTMRTLALRRASDRLYRNRITLDATLRARIPASPSARWTSDPPLPPDFFATPSADREQPAFNSRPIARGGRAWGMLVLGQSRPRRFSAEQSELLQKVTERLAIAFVTAERDRRLHLLAHRDPLTGLPNRHALLELLDQEISRAKRQDSRVAVLFLDLDRFKQANDTLGHAVGDALLTQAARRIRDSVRGEDVVARLGGDEFTVVLGNLAVSAGASQVARQLIKSLSAPFEVDGHTIYVGASVGIAVFPDDGADGADLLKKADTAMYRAKENGRSRLVYFEEQMNRDALHRAALDRELRRALRDGEFVLYYQPVLSMRTGRLCSVEALLRWHHPEHGVILPANFIPFAEENNLIDAIGIWVLRQACQQYRRWHESMTPIPKISVNVSFRQLRRSSFVRNVLALLDANHVPPGALEIEVTETVFVEGGAAAMDALTVLARAGVQIAIDDFGSGYSSFGYLRTLPAGVLKLDRSFIIGVPQAPEATSIVAAMISVAHTLRKEVVAEGVDSPAQIDCLRGLGCDKVQGYFFCPPVPATEVAIYARHVERRKPAPLGSATPQAAPADAERAQRPALHIVAA